MESTSDKARNYRLYKKYKAKYRKQKGGGKELEGYKCPHCDDEPLVTIEGALANYNRGRVYLVKCTKCEKLLHVVPRND